jgi:hypothetical protein
MRGKRQMRAFTPRAPLHKHAGRLSLIGVNLSFMTGAVPAVWLEVENSRRRDHPPTPAQASGLCLEGGPPPGQTGRAWPAARPGS